MKKTNIAVLILLVMVICAMAVFTACETTQEDNSPVKYTVTFDSNGGSAVKAQTVEQGKKVALPAEPTKDNCDFVGWYTEDNKPYDFDSAVNANFTLYAKWQEIKPAVTYTVTFDANGGSAVKSQEVEEGGKATVPEEPYYEGYDFIGWYTDEDTLYDFNTEVCANLTLTAKWSSKVTVEEIKYTDINEFYSSLSVAEADTFKNTLSNAILTKDVISSTTLVRMYGYGTTAEDISLAKIAFVKGDNDYVKLQCLASQTNNNGKITYVAFDLDLTNAIEKDNLSKTLYSGKFTNVEKNGDAITKITYFDKSGKEQIITAGEGIIISGDQASGTYSVVDFEDCLNLINATNCVSSTNKVMCALDITPTQEQKDLFNLLMPYLISEETNYSHITVSYMSSTNPNFPKTDCYTFQLKGYNEKNNHFEHYEIVVPESNGSGANIIEKISDSILEGQYKYQIKEDKQMISGDIIIEMEEEKDIIEINPKV